MNVVDQLSVRAPAVSVPPRARASAHAKGFRIRPAGFAAIGVLLVCWGALVAVHHVSSPVIPRARAISIAERSPMTRRMLAAVRWDRVEVLAMDSRHDGVWFFKGPSLRVAAIVALPGIVQYDADPARQRVAYGSNIANNPMVLAVLGAVFVLMTASWPIRQIRNLDVAALAATTASIVLLNDGQLGRMVALGALVLFYLGVRCAWLGFATQPGRASPVSLFERLTDGWEERQRVRVLRMLLVACGLVLAMIGISSTGVVDVGWAVMEGGTDLLHGVLPYGHVPGVLHGDTYPIGSYLLYTPAAWFWPVRDAWDSADATLFVAVAAALAGAFVLRHASSGGQPDRRSSGPSVATLQVMIAWLTFPALVVTVSTGSTDAVLAAVILATVLAWRRPAAVGALVAGGAWFKLVPLALLPVLLAPLRGRRLAMGLFAAALVSIVALAPLVALGGIDAVAAMGHAVGYQAARASPQSLWAVIGSVPLQQLVQAATIALVVAAAIRLRRDRALASDRRRVAALSAAVMIGLQLSASYWTYLYVSWALPGLMLSLLWSDASQGATPA